MASSDDAEPRILPKDYEPGPLTVLVGRGKKCVLHEGNKRLRMIVKEELTTYQECRSKSDKSIILLGIVRQIRKSNSDGVGFVKKDLSSGRWYELTEFSSRVVVAQAFRDALSGHYKSSKQSKQHKRQLEKQRESGPSSNPAPHSHSPTGSSGTGLTVNDAIAVARMRNQLLSKTSGDWPASASIAGSWAASRAFGANLLHHNAHNSLSNALNRMEQSKQTIGSCGVPSRTSWNVGYGGAQVPPSLLPPIASCPSYYHMNYQGYLPRPPACYLNQAPLHSQFQNMTQQMGAQAVHQNISLADANPCNDQLDVPPSDNTLVCSDLRQTTESCKEDLYDVFSSIPLPDLKAALSA